MSPIEFAALALHTDVRCLSAAEPIKHGLTNQSWLVRSDCDVVVVRISNPSSDRLLIDRDSECIILDAVGSAGIGAPVLLCDPQQRVLVTRYLGSHWSDRDAQLTQNIARLGTTFRKLHSIQPPTGVHRVALQSVLDSYLRTLERSAQCDVSLVPQLRGLAMRLDGRPPSLCHNDVHRLNIVDNGSIRLIDWEYAGVGSPPFDLASVCVYHAYSAAQREVLLAAYARPDSVSPLLLEQACELFDYIRGLWLQVRQLTDQD